MSRDGGRDPKGYSPAVAARGHLALSRMGRLGSFGVIASVQGPRPNMTPMAKRQLTLNEICNGRFVDRGTIRKLELDPTNEPLTLPTVSSCVHDHDSGFQ